MLARQRIPTVLATLAAALLIILPTTGCASLGQGGGEPAYATLIVDNDSPMTVNVYTYRSGQRMRLGQVFGLRTEEFALRRSMLGAGGDLRLLIDPLGSRANYPSQSITVFEGDIVELQVSNFIR